MAIKKKYRDLTIGELYKGNKKSVPMLRMSGMWLEELGFKCGDYVRVECENGQIIITPNLQRAEEEAAKKEFMDAEIIKLKAKFKKEKDEIYARYVAEHKTEYGKAEV